MKKLRELYFQIRPGYILPGDAYKYLRTQRILKSVLYVILGVLLLVWPIQMLTSLFSLYQDFGAPIPIFTKLAPYLFVLLAVVYFACGIYMILSRPDKKKIMELAHKSNKTGQIKIVDLYELKDFEVPLFMSLLLLVFLILSSLALYLPLYALGNSI